MPRTTTNHRSGNRLLDLLPRDEYNLLLPACEVVSLPPGREIYREDGPLSHVYFPRSGVCSVVTRTNGGRSVEAATVGKEGMVGISAFLDLDFSPAMVTSQVPGDSLRIPVRSFLRAVKPGGTLDRLLRRYIAFSLRNAYQTGACNAMHSVEERMCRWLLLTQDRAEQEEFLLTQEFLAMMLGVRRQTVTVIAGTLQMAGLITYRRGVLRVLNREGLEAASCECYEVLRLSYDQIVK
jgi:CRP-like cAMP-binding protein